MSNDEPDSPYENIKKAADALDALLDQAAPVVDAVRDALAAAADPAAPDDPPGEPALR